MSVSLWGCVLVTKFLVLSKFVYPFTYLPYQDAMTTKLLQQEIHSFLWPGRKTKMSHIRMIQRLEKGGFSSIDVKKQCSALKFRILNKAFYNKQDFWAHHISTCFKVGLDIIVKGNIAPSQISGFAKCSIPTYWKETLCQ